MNITWIGLREKKFDNDSIDKVAIRLEDKAGSIQIDIELEPFYVIKALLPLIQSALPNEIMEIEK